jgi:hypothetical protein
MLLRNNMHVRRCGDKRHSTHRQQRRRGHANYLSASLGWREIDKITGSSTVACRGVAIITFQCITLASSTRRRCPYANYWNTPPSRRRLPPPLGHSASESDANGQESTSPISVALGDTGIQPIIWIRRQEQCQTRTMAFQSSQQCTSLSTYSHFSMA